MNGYFGTERLVVGFTGSREWPKGVLAQANMAVQSVFMGLEQRAAPQAPIIVHGGAGGVDAWVAEEAKRRRWPTVVFTPAWCEGRHAGPMRNEWMVELLADHGGTLYAIWNGSSTGARSCFSRACEARVVVLRWTAMYTWQGWDPQRNTWVLWK